MFAFWCIWSFTVLWNACYSEIPICNTYSCKQSILEIGLEATFTATSLYWLYTEKYILWVYAQCTSECYLLWVLLSNCYIRNVQAYCCEIEFVHYGNFLKHSVQNHRINPLSCMQLPPACCYIAIECQSQHLLDISLELFKEVNLWSKSDCPHFFQLYIVG